MKTREIIIPVGTKKYPLSITYTWKIDKTDGEIVKIYCQWAGIDQEYLKDDLPLLLEDIEDLIVEHQLINKTSNINIRVKTTDKLEIEKKAARKGYNSVSEYILQLALSN